MSNIFFDIIRHVWIIESSSKSLVGLSIAEMSTIWMIMKLRNDVSLEMFNIRNVKSFVFVIQFINRRQTRCFILK